MASLWRIHAFSRCLVDSDEFIVVCTSYNPFILFLFMDILVLSGLLRCRGTPRVVDSLAGHDILRRLS